LKNKKIKERKNVAGLVLIVLALVLLGGSIVGSARAALTYYSEDYVAQMDVKSIGVSLAENGKVISWRDYLHKDDAWTQKTGELLTGMLGKDEKLLLGKKYKEELSVTNSGSIDEYVRVTIHRYWVDCDSSGKPTKKKRTDMDPALIQLNFPEGSGWIIDKAASTPERTVLYYNRVLPSGSSSSLFADTLAIDSSVMNIVTKGSDPSYFYQDVQFMIEAEVDAVQTHNAEDAIKSAWGVDVNVGSDGSLSLK